MRSLQSWVQDPGWQTGYLRCEKKPLFNFMSGSKVFSIGSVGCNFHCKHCQNDDISQYPHEYGGEIIGLDRTPEQIVATAKAAGCETIAYTYAEPTIFYEFAYDTAIPAQKEKIKNVFVSNGYMSAESALRILFCESPKWGFYFPRGL